MAGGRWTEQNKVRPGVYVNTVGQMNANSGDGKKGIVAFACYTDWGPTNTFVSMTEKSNFQELIGYMPGASGDWLIRPFIEAFKRAKTVLFYRLNSNDFFATASGGYPLLNIQAKYPGVFGNRLRVKVQTSVEDTSKKIVTTYLNTGTKQIIVDQQTIADGLFLQSNQYVNFRSVGTSTGDEEVDIISYVRVPICDLTLAGGTSGTRTNADHTNFLSKLETQEFDSLAYYGYAIVPGDDDLKPLYANFIKRLRNEGKKVQAVIPNYSANDEGIINLMNGVKLSNGKLTFGGSMFNTNYSAMWVAGALAAAEPNDSLTYLEYEDAVDVDIRYSPSEIEDKLRAGCFVFTPKTNRVVVEQDINSLTSFTDEKPEMFRKNRVIRTLDAIESGLRNIFETSFIGRVTNTADGRNLFKQEAIRYLERMALINAIQPIDAQADVFVNAGMDQDSVLIEMAVQPIDSIEKIYMKVQVS